VKSNHKSILLLLGLLILATATGLAALPLSTQKTSSAIGQQKNDDDQVPVIDFANADNPATKQKARKRRGSLRQPKAIDELPGGVEPLPLAGHQFARLPALPVAESNAIVLGKIIARNVILTDDKLGIYSEFSIQVTKVFKDDHGVPGVGASLEVSRAGGAIRFPSGKIQQYTISNQGYPKQGGLYVLFLKRDDEGDFSIVTGYDLSSPGVTPLDGEDPQVNLPFSIYRGMAKDSFLNELQDAVTKTTGGGD